MRGLLCKLAVVVVGTLFLVGCGEDDSTVQTVKDENSRLKSENAQLESSNKALNKDVADANASAAAANSEAAHWKTVAGKADHDMSSAPASVSPEVAAKLQAMSGKYWEYKNGVLRAQADTFFASGSADLKPEAKTALKEIVPQLKDILADKSVLLRVDGHTDSDPLVKTAPIWKDNLNLSVARARAVVEQLKEDGVPAESMSVAGWGDIRPIPGAPKEKNRRVELVIVPAGM